MSEIVSKTFRKYKYEFYSKLSGEERQAIYNGAMTLANGFLNFDAKSWYIESSFAGCGAALGQGGGAIALSGRLFLLSKTYGILLRIATDIAIDTGLIKPERLRPKDVLDEVWKACFDEDGTPDLDKIKKLWEASGEDEQISLNDETETDPNKEEIDSTVTENTGKDKDNQQE